MPIDQLALCKVLNDAIKHLQIAQSFIHGGHYEPEYSKAILHMDEARKCQLYAIMELEDEERSHLPKRPVERYATAVRETESKIAELKGSIHNLALQSYQMKDRLEKYKHDLENMHEHLEYLICPDS